MAPKMLSLRGLAGKLGASEGAVRKAIRAGRLAKSIGRDGKGRPFVSDLALARQEWETNRGQRSQALGKGNGHAAVAEPALETRAIPATLTEGQIRLNLQREVKLELENLQRQGKLLDAGKVKRESYGAARMIRDGLLNLPDRVSAEVAAMTDAAEVHERLTVELRAVLAPLADALAAGPDGMGADG